MVFTFQLFIISKLKHVLPKSEIIRAPAKKCVQQMFVHSPCFNMICSLFPLSKLGLFTIGCLYLFVGDDLVLRALDTFYHRTFQPRWFLCLLPHISKLVTFYHQMSSSFCGGWSCTKIVGHVLPYVAPFSQNDFLHYSPIKAGDFLPSDVFIFLWEMMARWSVWQMVEGDSTRLMGEGNQSFFCG